MTTIKTWAQRCEDHLDGTVITHAMVVTTMQEEIDELRAKLDALEQPDTFQSRVQPWLMECFGAMIAGDREERNHRFLEESLELVQSLGCSQENAHQLVDYVYGRPIGEPSQEVGGVMVTLAALCLANQLDMHRDGETELARITRPEMVLKIRAKQAAKPKYSPLPEVQHDSDCAVHNGPAYTAGPCDCDVAPLSMSMFANKADYAAAMRDAITGGTGILQDGKRVDPQAMRQASQAPNPQQLEDDDPWLSGDDMLGASS